MQIGSQLGGVDVHARRTLEEQRIARVQFDLMRRLLQAPALTRHRDKGHVVVLLECGLSEHLMDEAAVER